jgi:hypothetical protein
MKGRFLEKNIDLTSSEPDCGIFCATDLPSDSQSHVLYCALCVCVCVCVCACACVWVCVSILARSGQASLVTLSLLVNVRHSIFSMIGVLSKHTHTNKITVIGCVSNCN